MGYFTGLTELPECNDTLAATWFANGRRRPESSDSNLPKHRIDLHRRLCRATRLWRGLRPLPYVAFLDTTSAAICRLNLQDVPDVHVRTMHGDIHPLVTAGIKQVAGNPGIKQSPVELFLPFGVQLRWVGVVKGLDLFTCPVDYFRELLHGELGWLENISYLRMQVATNLLDNVVPQFVESLSFCLEIVPGVQHLRMEINVVY